MSKPSHLSAFARFILVGGSFSAGYAIVTAGLINLAGSPPLITSIVVYLICIPLAFAAQKNFAFQARGTGRSALFLYTATQVASLVFVATFTSRYVTMNLILDTGLYLVTAGTAAVLSYLICRFVIFR
ncbi:GtrA family protein [Yoonia sp.]|uniref:GtrA family protein n=1 Tax=Yoonia sp. TaxID=2212373 RepID=UPI0035C7D130